MIFSKDSKLTDMARLARHFALAILLATPIPGYATLQTPKRPATIEPARSSFSSRQLSRSRRHRTYLAMVGPAALTFADTGPTLPPEPVMPEPPKSRIQSAKTTPAAGNNTNLQANSTAPEPAADTPALNDPADQPANSPNPVSILPDDTRREIRAEDVLPYFQFPGANDVGAVAIPITINQPQAPTTAPPSTATYRQQ